MPQPPNSSDINRQKVQSLRKYSSLLSVLNNQSVNSRDFGLPSGPLPTPTNFPAASPSPTATATPTVTPSVTPTITLTPSQVPCEDITNISLSNLGNYDLQNELLSALVTFTPAFPDICNTINVNLDLGGGNVMPLNDINCDSPQILLDIPFAGTLIFNTYCSTGQLSQGASFTYDYTPTPQYLQLTVSSLPEDPEGSTYSMFLTLCGTQALTAVDGIFNNFIYTNSNVNQNILGASCFMFSLSTDSYQGGILYYRSNNAGYSCSFAASGLTSLASFNTTNTTQPGVYLFANRDVTIQNYFLPPSPSPTPTPTVTSYLTPTPTPSITPTPTQTRAAISTIDLTSTTNVRLTGLRVYDINNNLYSLYSYNLSTLNGTYSAAYDAGSGLYTLANVANDKHIIYYDAQYANCWTLVLILDSGIYFPISIFNNYYDTAKLPVSAWTSTGANSSFEGVNLVPYFALSGFTITKILASPTPSQTPTSTSTPTPTPSPTVTPSPTRTPTVTPTKAPNVFDVSNDGSGAYIINTRSNPVLILSAGETYVFNVNAAGHPFWIKTVSSLGTVNAYSTGVTYNGTDNGTITFVVPAGAPSTLYYNCQFHGSMAGTINILNVIPPTPTPTPTPTTSTSPTRTPTPTVTPSAAAPSGLPASSTGNLRITFADQTNGLASKYSATYWSDYLGDGNENRLEWTGTIWRLRRIESGDPTGIDYPFPAEATNNTSTAATIPTTGWVYTISSQYYNNSIVITAA